MSLNAIIFDFDGTIVESVDTKTEAFRTLFARESGQLDRIIALHLEHGGRSRYEKFAMIYRDILQRDPLPGEFDELGRRFEALVFDAVATCPFVPGAEAFLSEYAVRLPLILVSGTPHAELMRVLERRDLVARFREIHGSPREKEEIIRDVLERHAWAAKDLLFVGDAMSDCLAAASVGVPFIGRVHTGTLSRFRSGVPTIADFSELPGLLPGVESAPRVGDGW